LRSLVECNLVVQSSALCVLPLLSSIFDLKMFRPEKTFETLVIINARRSLLSTGWFGLVKGPLFVRPSYVNVSSIRPTSTKHGMTSSLTSILPHISCFLLFKYLVCSLILPISLIVLNAIKTPISRPKPNDVTTKASKITKSSRWREHDWTSGLSRRNRARASPEAKYELETCHKSYCYTSSCKRRSSSSRAKSSTETPKKAEQGAYITGS
jgi:hypothetical protein